MNQESKMLKNLKTMEERLEVIGNNIFENKDECLYICKKLVNIRNASLSYKLKLPSNEYDIFFRLYLKASSFLTALKTRS